MKTIQGLPADPNTICQNLEASNNEPKQSASKKIARIILAMQAQHLRVSTEIQQGMDEFLGQTGSVA